MSITRQASARAGGVLAATVAALVILVAGAVPAVPHAGAAPAGPLWDVDLGLATRGTTTGFAADLDEDGREELVLHRGYRNGPSRVVVLEVGEGSEVWRAEFAERSQCVAVDAEGDGASEIAAASGARLLILNGETGERVESVELAAPFGDLAACRLPGGAGVVCTSGTKRDDTIAVFEADGLRELWSRTAHSADGPFARGFTRPSALDIDGDGVDEIIVVENGNHLLCLSGSGELMWNVGLGRRERLRPDGVVSAGPVVARLLGGGVSDLAVGCFAGALVLIEAASGQVLDRFGLAVGAHDGHLDNPRLPRFVRDALRETGEPLNSIAAVELDGSDGLELVVGCSDRRLYALDPGGGVLWRAETAEKVYDPVLVLSEPGGRRALLAWDARQMYTLDPRTGEPVDFAPVAGLLAVAAERGTTTVIRVGTDLVRGPDCQRLLVHISSDGNRVSAWPDRVPPADAGSTADGGEE